MELPLPASAGRVLSRRQEGQAPEVIAHSWKAQHRLHKVFDRLAFRKGSQIAAVAVARELAGFVWAVMQDCGGGTEAGDALVGEASATAAPVAGAN